MPSRIRLAKQRLVLAKLFLGLLRCVTGTYMGTQQHGSSADDAALLCAVYVGQAERKRMTAHKLAAYVGMPRATVNRKLREMKAAGLVDFDRDGGACLMVDKLNDARMVAGIEAAIRSAHSAAAELSKMDR